MAYRSSFTVRLALLLSCSTFLLHFLVADANRRNRPPGEDEGAHHYHGRDARRCFFLNVFRCVVNDARKIGSLHW